MQIESRKNRQNKKAKRLNSIRGTQRFTKPSQTNGGANIRINSETAIPKLKNLAQEYIGVSDPYGFLTNLREALGIPNSQGASKYGVVTIPKEDGSVLEASLRITNHNSDAETYITHNANYEYNLSILVRKNFKPNTFKPHNDVVLDEFVYYGKRMQRVENPLTQIINSIIGFLQSGVYNDTTGVAFKNTSPQTNDNNKLNCNTNMNKKLIRLTENDLHKIVNNSIRRILDENTMPTDEERALRCLQTHLGNVRMILAGGLDQMMSTFQMKMYGGNRMQKEAYYDIVEDIEDINDYAEKLARKIEKAQKHLQQVAGNQQQQMQQPQQQQPIYR